MKSGIGGRDLGIGIRAGYWYTEPEPFLFPSCACKAFRGLHLKTQEEFNGQKHFSKCMKRYLS